MEKIDHFIHLIKTCPPHQAKALDDEIKQWLIDNPAVMHDEKMMNELHHHVSFYLGKSSNTYQLLRFLYPRVYLEELQQQYATFPLFMDEIRVKWINQNKGKISYFNANPEVISKILKKHASKIKRLNIDSLVMKEEIMKYLPSFSQLEVLSLTFQPMTVNEIKPLLEFENVKKIKYLEINAQNKITDIAEIISKTPFNQLERLNLFHCGIDIRETKQLIKSHFLKTLKILELQFNELTEEAVNALLDTFQLNFLDIRHNPLIQMPERLKARSLIKTTLLI